MNTLAVTASLIVLASSPAATDFKAVEFKDHDTSAMSLAIERQFVRPMLQVKDGAPIVFRWARFDADGDGYDELAIELREANMCSTDGCPVVAFRRSPEDNWKPILTVVTDSLETGKDADGAIVRTGRRAIWRYEIEAFKMKPVR